MLFLLRERLQSVGLFWWWAHFRGLPGHKSLSEVLRCSTVYSVRTKGASCSRHLGIGLIVF